MGVKCHLFPSPDPAIRSAVVEAGGEVVPVDEAEVLIHTGGGADDLRATLDDAPGVRWVQLRGAGIDRFVHLLDTDRTWTSAKGAYSLPVAEHALALTLGGMRGVVRYARQSGWSDPYGHNLKRARVVVVGGGGIARRLVSLFEPLGAEVTVVRRRNEEIAGAEVVGVTDLPAAVENASAVVLALALTPETRGIVDSRILRRMRPDAWLVNVARGAHVVTPDLVAALENDEIGGAALDVTDPEPLPGGHPLWAMSNVVITPHVGSTPQMHLPYYLERIKENLVRFGQGQPLVGMVDVAAGY